MMNYSKLLLCAVISLAGCSASSPPAVPSVPDEQSAVAETDKTPVVIGWKEGRMGDYLGVIVDGETGCEYITYSSYAYAGGRAITPRIASNGRHICKGNPNS